jgi:hypothetical protein
VTNKSINSCQVATIEKERAYGSSFYHLLHFSVKSNTVKKKTNKLIFVVVVLGFELRAFTLSHFTSPFL